MYCGSVGLTPLILNFGIRWWSVVSFMLWPLYLLGMSPQHPLEWKLGSPRASLDAVAKRKGCIIAPARN